MTEPIWIETQEALLLHARLLALHGGASGLRDEGLLQSALARPQQMYAYAEKSDMIEMASACTAGIVGNHPFVDGNKRTGFVVGVLFLELNFASPPPKRTRPRLLWNWRPLRSMRRATRLSFERTPQRNEDHRYVWTPGVVIS
jgi:death-on-curing family protein